MGARLFKFEQFKCLEKLLKVYNLKSNIYIWRKSKIRINV